MEHCTRFLVLLWMSILLFTACGQQKEPESEAVSQHAEETEKVDIIESVNEQISKQPAGEMVEEGIYDITEYLHMDGCSVSGMYLIDNEHLLVALLDQEQYLKTKKIIQEI